MLRSEIRPALVILACLTVLTGAVYPLLVTGIAQAIFPEQANGSLIVRDGRTLGSSLIGQAFDDPGYFWGRLSATGPAPYHGAASSGSNLGPLNPGLAASATARIEALRAADPGNRALVPVDLVTASGSGLDPHISPAAAMHQIPRVARARGISEAVLKHLVEEHVERRQLGILGEECVNVLVLNLALEEQSR